MDSGADISTTALESPRAGVQRTTVGRYELIYPLGQGGMASVYVGQASGMAGFEKLVAIKIIHPHLGRERKFVDMFLDEAKLAAQIIHPNVAAVHEIGEQHGLLYMVGDLVQGESLKTLLRRVSADGASLSQPMAAHIAADICSGLHAAHELQDSDGRPFNLVHRDVSPQNVLIGFDGFVKLIDFGVAQAKGRLSHTEAGTIKGKMGYLSPEQLKGEVLDRRSDIFSLGVVLYLMLTGKHPFPGKTSMDRLNAISASKYQAPRELNPDLAPELERIIETALANKREDRFPTASSMSETLNAFVRSQSEAAGARQLATIMERLFEPQIAVHREKLRTWRERGEGVGPLPVVVDNAALPVNAGQGAEQGGHSETSVSIARHRRGAMVRWVAGGAVAAALLAAGVVLYAVVDWNAPEQERESSAGDVRPGGREDVAAANPSGESDDPKALAEPTEFSFTFEVSPHAARIFIDGQPLPDGVREVTVPADGEIHKIDINAKGYQPQERELTADRDQTVRVVLAEQKRRRWGKPTTKKKVGAEAKKPKDQAPKKALKESPY